MAIVTLIAGLILLVLAGDALVRSAVSAARRMHIPPIIIGLTVVAFGTSAPELIVSVEAALEGAPDLAIGNIIGSNLTNTLLVLGLPALITPIILVESGIRRSLVFMILISLGFSLMILDHQLARFEGLILFALLVIYLTYSGIMASRARRQVSAPVDLDALEDPPLKLPKILIFLTFGIVGLGLGGKLTTDGALAIAENFGIADSAIGLTIVALGTTLPELATSIAAARRRQTVMIIGNVIGSNIFNILGIAGITAMLAPLEVGSTLVNIDVWVMLAASIMLVPIAFFTRRINRLEGAGLTLAYLVYTLVILIRGMQI